MNEKFFELSAEKQQRIINATMEVFAKNDYKHASTDLIAAKSGVSKGLLFYYFHNKKELFLYVFNYCIKITFEAFNKPEMQQITDFFEMLEYGSNVKLGIFEKNPYLVDFIMNSYYSYKEDITEDMASKIAGVTNFTFKSYLANVDMSKFKEGVDVLEIYKMLVWVGDGYLNEKRRLHEPIDAVKAAADFNKMASIIKQSVYKPEYL